MTETPASTTEGQSHNTLELSTARAWLEKRGIPPEDTAQLTMTDRELELLKDIGLGEDRTFTSFLTEKIRKEYGIPSDAHYISVDVVPDGSDLPHVTRLITVDVENFGKELDGSLDHSAEPEDTLNLTMTDRELELLKILGMHDTSASDRIQHARDLLGVPRDDENDQYAPKYALIEKPSGEVLIVDITEVDFGTKINYLQDQDLEPDPDNPPPPDSVGTYVTISNERFDQIKHQAVTELQEFKRQLMTDERLKPLIGDLNRDFWARAGDIEGNDDVFVWDTHNPITRAIELTVAFPGKYDSICFVAGNKQAPVNHKINMAQINNPHTVLKIEGDALTKLKAAYEKLYSAVPFYALTQKQREERDQIFNEYVMGIINSTTTATTTIGAVTASEIDAVASASAARTAQKPRAREIPFS